MEDLFKRLKKAGIPRGTLWAAWDFTVSSERSISARQLAIRDDAFKQLGDTNLADRKVQGHAPKFTITKVTDFAPCDPGGCADGQDPDTRRQVEGTYEVPCYLNAPGCVPGSTFNYGFGAHDDTEWISAVAEECQHSVVTVLLIPGIGTVHDLKEMYKAGARSVRVASQGGQLTEAEMRALLAEAGWPADG